MLQAEPLRMSRHKNEIRFPSRRAVLKSMGLAPLLLRPAPFHGFPFLFGPPKGFPNQNAGLPFLRCSSDAPLSGEPPLWKMSSALSLRVPMITLLKNMPWKSSHFSNNGAKPSRHRLRDLSALAKSLDPSIEASALVPAKEITLRAGNGIDYREKMFDGKVVPGRERFLQQIRAWLGQVSGVETAEFEITSIEEIASAPLTVRAGHPL